VVLQLINRLLDYKVSPTTVWAGRPACRVSRGGASCAFIEVSCGCGDDRPSLHTQRLHVPAVSEAPSVVLQWNPGVPTLWVGSGADSAWIQVGMSRPPVGIVLGACLTCQRGKQDVKGAWKFLASTC
jgi:hypothetical protein